MTAAGAFQHQSPAHVAGFGDRLASRIAARGSQLVLGLDPDPAGLWPRAIELAGLIARSGVGSPLPGSPLAGGPRARSSSVSPATQAARAVAAHCEMAIDAVAEHCVAVKPQVACFERLGAPGWAALAEVVERARERGLLVLADGKRGDIDISAVAYAQAFFGETETPFGRVNGLGVDALTVNPLLGVDSLAPLVECARARASGVFVLVRTSNPGASDVQDLRLGDGGSVSDRLAAIVAELGVPGTGKAGLADVGAVVGATAPHLLQTLREEMPHAVFLLPGVGAQGARVEDLRPAFAPGPGAGLVAVSRGIVNAHQRTGGVPAVAAEREAARLRALVWRLAS
ncbi:MAG: orotidine-5'-phosphate decarboxylase [Solirubrobacteraceae bacterium]